MVGVAGHASQQKGGARQLKTATNTRHGRAQTRVLTAHGTRGQTHDDCQWLDEEDGEENVLGNVRGRNWCDSPPAVAQNESRHRSRKSDPSSQNGVGDGGDERGAGLAGVFVFRGCAAVVRLHLADAARCRALRVSLVHRARTLGAARHTRFRGRRPSGADGCVSGRNQNGQRNRKQLPAEDQHLSRMQDGATGVNSASIWRLLQAWQARGRPAQRTSATVAVNSPMSHLLPSGWNVAHGGPTTALAIQ